MDLSWPIWGMPNVDCVMEHGRCCICLGESCTAISIGALVFCFASIVFSVMYTNRMIAMGHC